MPSTFSWETVTNIPGQSRAISVAKYEKCNGGVFRIRFVNNYQSTGIGQEQERYLIHKNYHNANGKIVAIRDSQYSEVWGMWIYSVYSASKKSTSWWVLEEDIFVATPEDIKKINEELLLVKVEFLWKRSHYYNMYIRNNMYIRRDGE